MAELEGGLELRPREYAFWPPPPAAPEWGLLMCDNDEGRRWTLRGDRELVRMIEAAPPGILADAQLGGEWEMREEWPNEWPRGPDGSIRFDGDWRPVSL